MMQLGDRKTGKMMLLYAAVADATLRAAPEAISESEFTLIALPEVAR